MSEKLYLIGFTAKSIDKPLFLDRIHRMAVAGYLPKKHPDPH
jgi:hypothetical protein